MPDKPEMTYLVTARKWRPQRFDDVVGQNHVTTTLRNAIAGGRLSHAYLFSGPRGVGKTTTARILAKAINCLHPRETNPDNECELCVEITEGRSLNVFEIDGASNRGVDEIRNLREAVRYAPARGAYKVYVIDEIHMLTREAFNALLKTLEEPPPHVVFVFATTEIHKVPLTILSRCQRFDFRRVPLEDIVARLRMIATAESIAIDDDALFLIAKRSDGALRDAQTMFDQIMAYCDGTIGARDIVAMLNLVDEELFFRTTDIIRRKDGPGMLDMVDDIIVRGYDLREFLGGLAEHLRNLLVVATTGSTKHVETSEAYRSRYADEARSFSPTDLLRLIAVGNETDTALRWNQAAGGGRYRLEAGLMQMVKLDSSVEIGRLLEEIDELKKKLAAGIRTDSPVRGSVKASQPALRPEQIVRPSGMTVAEPTPIGSARPSRDNRDQTLAAAPASPSITLSSDEVAGKWSQLIDEARRERIAVGTWLSETSLVEVRDNSLRIACPDDFHLESLKRNRQFIQELAHRIYGARIRLETILGSTPQGNSAKPEQEIQETETSRIEPEFAADPREKLRRHPIVRAIAREFAAREVLR